MHGKGSISILVNEWCFDLLGDSMGKEGSSLGKDSRCLNFAGDPGFAAALGRVM